MNFFNAEFSSKFVFAFRPSQMAWNGLLSKTLYKLPIAHELCIQAKTIREKKKVSRREMAEQNKVTLYGMWASPYVKTVELALKVKGIHYEYVEEDLRNKSPLLLKFNPVHKKVPVLVHNGKAIAESLVIIEYIDETWKTGPQLLPEDPYKRSQIRFWACYMQQVRLQNFIFR